MNIELPKGEFQAEWKKWHVTDFRPPRYNEMTLAEAGPRRCNTRTAKVPKFILTEAPPEYEPWTFETMPFVVKVRHKTEPDLVAVVMPRDRNCVSYSSGVMQYETLFNYWVKLDGSVCGKPKKQ